MTPDERIARARAGGASEDQATADVVAAVVAEAKQRYGATREIEVSQVGGAWETFWWRAVVEVPTDPERELSLAEARAIADSEWAAGDAVGVRLEPWW